MDEFFEFIRGVKKNKICYIHNINFDGTLMIEYMMNNDLKFTSIVVKTNIYMIKYQNVEFRCSYKLLPQSLSTIGKKLFNKDKMPYPYGILSRDVNTDVIESDFNTAEDYKRFSMETKIFDFRKYTTRYCENDVILTDMFVNEYWKTLGEIGILQDKKMYSASSISINTFYSKYNDYKVPKSLERDTDNYLRKGYYGGRCEVFGNPIEGDMIFHFDYSGMYAQCMTEEYPVSLTYCQGDIDLNHPGIYYIE